MPTESGGNRKGLFPGVYVMKVQSKGVVKPTVPATFLGFQLQQRCPE